MNAPTTLPRLTVIVGPTASGKTALGLQLAQAHNGAVISADSRQVYAGMNIGTAKPPDAWQTLAHEPLQPDHVAGTAHYLFNTALPSTPLTLADWQHDALSVIDTLTTNSTPAFLVGGTMLYVDSIIKNFTLPQVPPNTALRTALASQSTEQLYRQLLKQDPAAQTFIEPGNKRRIIRALEVIAATGQPFSVQRQQHAPRYHTTIYGVFPGWSELTHHLTTRAEAMFSDGLLTETEQLRQQYDKDLPLLATMNYRQAAAVLDGTLTQADALADTVRVNVRYARRQLSWWRNRPEIRWFTTASDAAAQVRQAD